MIQKLDESLPVRDSESRKVIIHPSYHLHFDKRTGFSVRYGSGPERDPFWCPWGPELVDLQVTGYCERGCPECYMNSSKEGKHIPLILVEEILDKLPSTVCQIALGGGEPTSHPHFVEILRRIRKRGIIPNYTTGGGPSLTQEKIEATKTYCGTLAISYHEGTDKWEAIRAFNKVGLKPNIHFVLSSETVEEAIDLLSGARRLPAGLEIAHLFPD